MVLYSLVHVAFGPAATSCWGQWAICPTAADNSSDPRSGRNAAADLVPG